MAVNSKLVAIGSKVEVSCENCTADRCCRSCWSRILKEQADLEPSGLVLCTGVPIRKSSSWQAWPYGAQNTPNAGCLGFRTLLSQMVQKIPPKEASFTAGAGSH